MHSFQTMKSTLPTKSHGFSLIELMISITLGAIILATTIQFVFSSKKTFNLNEDLARIQENARVAMDILAHDIRLAGYTDTNNLPEYFRLSECTSSFNPCNADGGNSQSDRLGIHMFSPSATDCLGNAASDLIANMYYLDDADSDGVSSLYCRGYDTNASSFISDALPIVDGVDDMQVLYGLSNASGQIVGYRNANNMSAADWSFVRSMRVGLLVSNGQVAGSEPSELRSYDVLDRTGVQFTDTHLRKVFTTTIFLNNAEAGTGL